MENPWKKLSDELKYENPWIKVNEHKVINPNNGTGIYGLVHFKNLAIGVIALDPDHNIYLVGQHRYPINEYSWEIPEGGGPLDQDPFASAQRELIEEVGITANKWTEFLRMHLSNSVSDELAIVYLAEDLIYGESSPEESEKLEVKKVSFATAFEMVMTGEITDSISVAAILKLKYLKNL